MDRTTIDWSGPMVAVTTPFRADLSIDEDAFSANVQRLYAAGATGIVAAGCTGEFWALDLAERERLARLTVAASAERGPAIIGTGSIREDEIITQIHAAKEAGADGVLVMPPYFVRSSEAEIIAHFEAIDAKSVLPILLYNIPGNAGNELTPEITDRLADLDNVVGIKESSGNWNTFQGTLNRAGGRIRVYCGPSSVLGVPAALAGADGTIDCFPNVWAPGCLDLWHMARAGRLAEAWALQRTGIEMTELFTTGGCTLYPATKAAMDHLGLPGGGPLRPPLRPLAGAALDHVRQGMDRLLSGKPEAA